MAVWFLIIAWLALELEGAGNGNSLQRLPVKLGIGNSLRGALQRACGADCLVSLLMTPTVRQVTFNGGYFISTPARLVRGLRSGEVDQLDDFAGTGDVTLPVQCRCYLDKMSVSVELVTAMASNWPSHCRITGRVAGCSLACFWCRRRSAKLTLMTDSMMILQAKFAGAGFLA